MSRSAAVTSPDAHPSTLLRAGAPLWRWPRVLPSPLARYVEEQLTAPWFACRVDAPADELDEALDAALDDAAVAATAGRELFTADVVRLAGLLASTAGSRRVKVRVEHDPGATCPVFHQDNNVVRLLCTYAGPGTEWLPEACLDRSQLGLQGRTPDGANRAIAVGEPMRSQPGEVLIVKGARYGAGHRSLVHKSPPPALGDRLFVSIDPVLGEPATHRPRRTSLRRQRSCS